MLANYRIYLIYHSQPIKAMPPETKALSDFQNIISSEMDLKDAIRSGTLDGYAIRKVVIQKTSFDDRHFNNVLVHSVTTRGLSFECFGAKAVQWTASDLCDSRFHFSEIDELNMQNCQARKVEFDQALVQNSAFFTSELQNISFSSAKVVKSQFQDVNMYGASFENAFVAQCQFTCSNNGNPELSRSNFQRSMIIDTCLKNANLFASNFANAILIRVDLRGSNLTMADFRGAVLIDCQLHPDDRDGALF